MNSQCGILRGSGQEKKPLSGGLAVVLQGGGASGAWQAGVLTALMESESVSFRERVVSVIGTSIGALNGALLTQMLNHSAGPAPPSLEEVWTRCVNRRLMTTTALHALIDSTLRPRLLVAGPVYFVATAAVMRSRFSCTLHPDYIMMSDEPGLHVFQFGPTHSERCCVAALALRASSAFPVLYRSMRHNGYTLRDGGMVANNPADIVRTLGVNDYLVLSPKWPRATGFALPVARRIDANMKHRVERLIGDCGDGRVCHLLPRGDEAVPKTLQFDPAVVANGFKAGRKRGHELCGGSLLDW